MRQMFSDGFNSFFHVAVGFTRSALLIGGSILYQIITPDVNTLIDLSEIMFGYFMGRLAGA